MKHFENIRVGRKTGFIVSQVCAPGLFIHKYSFVFQRLHLYNRRALADLLGLLC